jgi:hypothetical protein
MLSDFCDRIKYVHTVFQCISEVHFDRYEWVLLSPYDKTF